MPAPRFPAFKPSALRQWLARLPALPALPPLPELPARFQLPLGLRRPLLWALVAVVWLAAGWSWSALVAPWVAPAGEPLPMQRVGGPSPAGPAAPPPLAQALGAKAGQTAMPRPEEVRLVGLLSGTASGTITLSIQNGPVRTLSRGVTAADGWRFEGIVQGRAQLSRYGQTLEVPVPQAVQGLPPA